MGHTQVRNSSFPTENLFRYIILNRKLVNEALSLHPPSLLALLSLWDYTTSFVGATAMDIPEKLLQYRYQITIVMAVSLTFSLVLYAAPRILIILHYFWPLFASTTVFLVAVIAFGGVSKFSNEAHGEKAGEGLLDYVAAERPEHVDETQSQSLLVNEA